MGSKLIATLQGNYPWKAPMLLDSYVVPYLAVVMVYAALVMILFVDTLPWLVGLWWTLPFYTSCSVPTHVLLVLLT